MRFFQDLNNKSYPVADIASIDWAGHCCTVTLKGGLEVEASFEEMNLVVFPRREYTITLPAGWQMNWEGTVEPLLAVRFSVDDANVEHQLTLITMSGEVEVGPSCGDLYVIDPRGLSMKATQGVFDVTEAQQ